jgi:hypothetical protein
MRAWRRQDDVTVQPGARVLDSTNLAGRWINTNAQGRGIDEFIIATDGGRLTVRALTMSDPGLCDWGITEADLLCGSDVRAQNAMSFTAAYNFGEFQTELQGNVNLGLLVVASFNRAAGNRDYFGREFYRRGDAQTAPPSVAWTAAMGRVGGDDPDEPDAAPPGVPFDGSEMFGEWVNTNPDSSGIARLRVDGDGPDRANLRVWGAATHPIEWGPAPADLFALSSQSALAKAFSARYQWPGLAVKLQANIKQGVLVVASFTEFSDGSGRSNYFHREFFYRT